MVQRTRTGRVLVAVLVTGETVIFEQAYDKDNKLWKEPLHIWLGTRESDGKKIVYFKPLCQFSTNEYMMAPDQSKWSYWYEPTEEIKDLRERYLSIFYESVMSEQGNKDKNPLEAFTDFTITH